ncbi:hypothetical protein QTH89_13610 [Variovorax sp. J22G21]|uniref:hypothetical protein n=1 Tax=Variovorax fucosicus TaxID=3053517 RepID=UPI002578798E|nr:MULTISPECIES: hypothetical protein [unclassified Variovorax]MDM0037456.1 hypothetical protein [Variovorax sp. J22R193]MDM0056882.1 hypothetical protein [Variovorax sp. J22G47]MDM0062232.1 hypothetical protein [Variovorax sp. J22G21]
MKTSSVAAVVAGCTIVLGCDVEPHVLFVTDGNPFQALQLTDAQDGCTAPHRVSYLTSLDGGASRGCWVREGAYIRARFPNLGDKLIPVREFRRTTLAEYQKASLDDD